MLSSADIRVPFFYIDNITEKYDSYMKSAFTNPVFSSIPAKNT